MINKAVKREYNAIIFFADLPAESEIFSGTLKFYNGSQWEYHNIAIF